MIKVYCIYCQKEYSNKGIHTHYERTHAPIEIRQKYPTGNHGNYKKSGETLKKRFKEKKILEKHQYDLSPKICPKCLKNIEWKKRYNLFCSTKCAGMARKHSEETKIKIRESIKSKNQPKTAKYKICKTCFKEYLNPKSKTSFCSISCKKINKFSKERKRKIGTPIQEYRRLCIFKFNIFHYPEEFNLKLIEQYGFYKAFNRGNNPLGISRDHMYSIYDGFKNNIDPKIISHPANCSLLQQHGSNGNSSKGKKSSITLDTLEKRIKAWDEKYLADPAGVEPALLDLETNVLP